MIRALGIFLVALAVIVAFSTRPSPLVKESRFVVERRPLWRIPTARCWAIIFGAVIGLAAAALTLFPMFLRRHA